MRIEHSVIIHADIDRVWSIFTDMTCWKKWSTVLGSVSSDHDELTEGKRFKFCIRPFSFPVFIEPVVEEVSPGRRIVWSGTKHGIKARHEFIFNQENDSVLLTSRETFRINFLKRLLFHIPKGKLHNLSVLTLKELKEAAEDTSVL